MDPNVNTSNTGHGMMGHGTMDNNNMGRNTMGLNTMGNNNMGTNMGSNTMGTNTMGTNTMGTNTMGTNTMGTNTMGPNTMGPNTMGTNTMGHTSSGLAGTGVGAGAMASAKNAMDPNVNTHTTGHHHDHSMRHSAMGHDHSAGHHTSTGLAGTGVGAATMAGMKDTMDPNVHSRPTAEQMAGSPPRKHSAVPRSPTSPTDTTSTHSGVKDPAHAEAALAMLESGDAPLSAAMGRDPITGAKLPAGSTLAKVADAVAGDGDVNAAAAHARTSLDRSSVDATMSPTTTATLDAGAVAAERRHVGDSADVRALGDKMEAARLDDHDANRHHYGRDAALAGGAAAIGAGAMHHHNKNERAGDHTAGPHTSTGLAGTGLGASTAADVKNKMDPKVDSTTGATDMSANKHMVGDKHEHHYGRDAALLGGATAIGAGALHHHHKHEHAGDHTAGPHTSTGVAGTGLGASTAADMKNAMDPKVDSTTGHTTHERGLDTGAFGMMADKPQPADPNRIPPHTSSGLLGTGVGAETMAKIKNAMDPKVDMSLAPEPESTMRNRGPGHIAMPADDEAHPNLFARAESQVVDNTRMPGAYTDRVNQASKTDANVVVTPVEEHSRIF